MSVALAGEIRKALPPVTARASDSIDALPPLEGVGFRDQAALTGVARITVPTPTVDAPTA